MEPRHFTIEDLPMEQLVPDLFKRAALRTDDAMITFNWFEPGFPRQEMHHHPFDQFALLVSGRLTMAFEDRLIELCAGEAVYIPADVPHTGFPSSEEVAFNIDIFAPPRQDYLYFTANQDDWGDVAADAPRGTPFRIGGGS